MPGLSKLFARPATPPAAEIMVAPPRMDKVDFHIRRFTLALEQCEKGAERQAELERNLNYWLAIKAARGLL